MNLDFSQFNANQRYHLMTQTLIPRPIAWVLTDSGNDSLNLAPFSYFTPVSSNPALLMISVGLKPNGDKKDTLVNILKNILASTRSQCNSTNTSEIDSCFFHNEIRRAAAF